MRSIFAPLRRGFDRLFGRSPSTIHASTSAAHTLAGDIQRTVPRRDRVDTDAAVGAAVTRTIQTARTRSVPHAERVTRTSGHAADAQSGRTGFHDRRTQQLQHPLFVERMRAALEHDEHSTRVGHVVSWIYGFVVYGIGVVMALGDPAWVASTMRTVLDVPASVPIWAVWNLDVLLSITSAFGMTLVLLATAHLISAALASLIFRAPLLNLRAEYPEMTRTARVLTVRITLAIAVIGTAVIAGAIWFLHTITEHRFAGGITAAFAGGEAGGAASAITTYVTWLPVVVVLLGVIAEHPVFRHERQAARWSRRFRRQEKRDLRLDRRLERVEVRAYRAATHAMARLADVLADVTLRAQAELLEGSLVTGALDATRVLETLGVASDAAGDPSGEVGVAEIGDQVGRGGDEVRLDLSGRIAAGTFLTPMVSNRVAESIAAYTAVTASSTGRSSIARVWSDARTAARPATAALTPLETAPAASIIDADAA